MYEILEIRNVPRLDLDNSTSVVKSAGKKKPKTKLFLK